MKVLISKMFDFDAAHWLQKVPRGHKCRRLHGHTYRVEIICAGEPDRRGMVVDYAEIADAWADIHAKIDHCLLNTIRGLENPTTEIVAPWIFRHLAKSSIGDKLIRVRVYESSTTYCEFPA